MTITNESEEGEGRKKSFAEVLLDRMIENLIFWRTPTDDFYADMLHEGKRTTYSLKNCNNLIMDCALRYFDRKTLSGPTVSSIEAGLQAWCRREGIVREAHIRVGQHPSGIYYDLGEESNSYVKITPDGWEITEVCPIKFYKPKGMLPQVRPQKGGDVDLLRKYVRFEKDADFNLYLGWLVSVFNPVREYPILILNGAQGTAKSTITLLSKKLVDPHEFASFSEPKDVRDLVAYARSSYVISMDNISYIPNWLSDSMCRLTHGTAALGGRELYKDHDMAAFAAARSLILNGIPEFVERNDLADRVIQLHLQPISPEERRAGSDIMREFQEDLPQIFGAILDLAVAGMRKAHMNSTGLPLPRMADWARFAGHCIGFEKILAPYNANKEAAEESIAENNSVAAALINFLMDKEEFNGTMHELMAGLIIHKPVGDSYWPKNIRELASEIRRLEPSLKGRGVRVKKQGFHPQSRRSLYQFELPKGQVVSASRSYNA